MKLKSPANSEQLTYDVPQNVVPRTYLSPRLRVSLDCGTETPTQQNFRDECDINKIVPRLAANGTLNELIQSNAQYGDFSDVPSYQQSLHIVAIAEEQFSALSAELRARFQNDPAHFLAFVTDKSNLPEMVTLGLAKPLSVPATSPAAPVSAPPVTAAK